MSSFENFFLRDQDVFFTVLLDYCSFVELVRLDISIIQTEEREEYLELIRGFPKSNKRFFSPLIRYWRSYGRKFSSWFVDRNLFFVKSKEPLRFHNHIWRELIRKIDESNTYRQNFLSFEIEKIELKLTSPFDLTTLQYLPNVKYLKINGYKSHENMDSSSSFPVFPTFSLYHLRKLDLSYCVIDDQLLRAFSTCPSLQCLIIKSPERISTNIQMDMINYYTNAVRDLYVDSHVKRFLDGFGWITNQLEKVTFRGLRNSLSFTSFLQHSPCLKEFTIDGFSQMNLLTLLSTIFQYCLQLEVLRLDAIQFVAIIPTLQVVQTEQINSSSSATVESKEMPTINLLPIPIQPLGRLIHPTFKTLAFLFMEIRQVLNFVQSFISMENIEFLMITSIDLRPTVDELAIILQGFPSLQTFIMDLDSGEFESDLLHNMYHPPILQHHPTANAAADELVTPPISAASSNFDNIEEQFYYDLEDIDEVHTIQQAEIYIQEIRSYLMTIPNVRIRLTDLEILLYSTGELETNLDRLYYERGDQCSVDSEESVKCDPIMYPHDHLEFSIDVFEEDEVEEEEHESKDGADEFAIENRKSGEEEDNDEEEEEESAVESEVESEQGDY
jgi:hypothetical protein